MYEPVFLYLLIAIFIGFFGYSIYTNKDIYGLFTGIFNILIAISILNLKFGSRYVAEKTVVDNTTEIIYESEVIEIPEILIALLVGVIVLQLLSNLSLTDDSSLRDV